MSEHRDTASGPAVTDPATAEHGSLGRPSGPVRAPGYLPALDGLRAVAVAAVVAFHLGRLSGGFLGVDIFFVISGFLITRLLLAEHARDGAVSLRAFWARRFRRLMPVLGVVVLLVMIGSRAWLAPWRLTDIRDDALAALAYVANWRFIRTGQSYFASGGVSPLRHTWSLAIEEQFYVLWPLVILGALGLGRRLRRGPGAVLAVAGGLGLASAVWMAVVAADAGSLTRAYYGTDTRAFALCFGAVAATLWRPRAGGADVPAGRALAGGLPRVPTWVGVLAVVPIAVALITAHEDRQAFYRGGFQGFALCSVVLVVAVAGGGGAIAGLLAARPLVWLGRRSYGIYLWTWPLQIFAAEGHDIHGWRLDLLVVFGGLALATLSFFLIEEPIRTGRLPRLGAGTAPRSVHHAPGGHVLIRGFAGLAGVAVLVVGVASGAPDPPSFLRAGDAAVLERALADDVPAGRPAAESTTSSSVAPDVPADAVGREVGPFDASARLVVAPSAQASPEAVHGHPLRVLVLGDSVAWSVGWQVESRMPAGMELSDRAILGCGLMPVEARWVARGRSPQPYGPMCPRQADAEAMGERWGPDVAVLWFGSWEVYDQLLDGVRYRFGSDAYGRVLEERVQQRIDRFRALGVPTILVRVPCFGPDVARLGTERTDAHRVSWVNDRLRSVAARNRGWVRLVDPEDQLCRGDGTPRPTTPDGLPLRVDGTHFTEDSATWFWHHWLAGQVAAAFA